MRKNYLAFISFLILSSILISGCSASTRDQKLRTIIERDGLAGDPSIGRDLPNISEPLPQLGMMLFYTKALSAAQDAACVSCHHPSLGGGDGIPMSIGVDADVPELLGPGRTHIQGPLVPRNAPTTFNSGMWDAFMFHDGRIESKGKTPGANGADGYGIRTPDRPWGYPDPDAGENLVVAQARFPVTSEEEMRGFDFGTGHGNTLEVRDERTRSLLAAILGGYGEGESVLEKNEWLSEFQKAYNSNADAETLITFENIVHAIGEYERSQVFVDTPWRAYVQGDDEAISESAKRGAILFLTPVEEGGANCSVCHSGDFFTDEDFHVIAIPQIGRGKESGTYGDDDWGRYLETQNPDDKYAFRTPTLLNVEVTGPYGHDGAYESLEMIVRHKMDVVTAVNGYDFSMLAPDIRTHNAETYSQAALEQLLENRGQGVVTIEDLFLSDQDVEDIVNFMLTLTDPCVKDRSCLSLWIPDADTPNPDGLQLEAIDKDGNPL